MGVLDILNQKRKKPLPVEEETPDEYTIPELVPLDLTPMQNILAERKAQEETMRKYGIKRATDGSIRR